ncbi:MAG: type II toxin-antitoxin system RelE/ParE family toxin [Armatimonadetes bacterium]|nr:type II toxin-antitoxin system RelE/ParE family toxin [Armatimonadota bacterium]
MPPFRLVVARRFQDDFRALPRRIQGQVLKALERIQADPYRGQRLRGVATGQWRYRVGDYRIRYGIIGSAIHLYVVRHRKEVYR